MLTGILTSIVIGGIAGWLAGMFMKMEGTLIRNIIVGIIGGVIGSIGFGLLGLHASNAIGQIIFGFVGSCILLFILKKISK